MAVDQGYLAAVRAEIDKRLGWTSNPDRAVAWDEAVTTTLDVVGPLLEDRGRVAYLEARVGALHQQIADVRTGMRVAEQECIRDIELLMWLHAEADWERGLFAAQVVDMGIKLNALRRRQRTDSEEIARLRREVEFEARGANSFSGADARVVEGGDTP